MNPRPGRLGSVSHSRMAAAEDVLAVIQPAMRRVQRGTGLPTVFFGAARPDKSFLHVSDIVGARTRSLHGLHVGFGNGLGGLVMATGQPRSVLDYCNDSAITHQYDAAVSAEGLSSIAATPVYAGRVLVGLLYAGTHEPFALGTRTLHGMKQIADKAGNELAVRAEVRRRLAEMETAAALTDARQSHSERDWEHVRAAHADLRVIVNDLEDPAFRDRLVAVCEQLADSGRSETRRTSLSPRELDVIALVGLGCGNAEIGVRLHLETETVKAYLRNAMRKLDAHTRMEAVVVARRQGALP